MRYYNIIKARAYETPGSMHARHRVSCMRGARCHAYEIAGVRYAKFRGPCMRGGRCRAFEVSGVNAPEISGGMHWRRLAPCMRYIT